MSVQDRRVPVKLRQEALIQRDLVIDWCREHLAYPLALISDSDWNMDGALCIRHSDPQMGDSYACYFTWKFNPDGAPLGSIPAKPNNETARRGANPWHFPAGLLARQLVSSPPSRIVLVHPQVLEILDRHIAKRSGCLNLVEQFRASIHNEMREALRCTHNATRWNDRGREAVRRLEQVIRMEAALEQLEAGRLSFRNASFLDQSKFSASSEWNARLLELRHLVSDIPSTDAALRAKDLLAIPGLAIGRVQETKAGYSWAGSAELRELKSSVILSKLPYGIACDEPASHLGESLGWRAVPETEVLQAVAAEADPEEDFIL